MRRLSPIQLVPRLSLAEESGSVLSGRKASLTPDVFSPDLVSAHELEKKEMEENFERLRLSLQVSIRSAPTARDEGRQPRPHSLSQRPPRPGPVARAGGRGGEGEETPSLP